jgi:DNA-binding transcriptional LysR family regulator
MTRDFEISVQQLATRRPNPSGPVPDHCPHFVERDGVGRELHQAPRRTGAGVGRGVPAGRQPDNDVEWVVAVAGRVDIGTFQSVSNVILPAIVRRLRAEHPGCDIRLFEEETGEPALDDLDVMFFDGVGGAGVDHLKLLDDPYMLVTRPGVLPAGPVHPRQLDGMAVVAYPPICDQARLEGELADRGIAPRFVFRTVGNEAVLSMVRAGLGSALLPRLAVPHPDPDLAVHELAPALPPREIHLLWQAGRSHSPLAAKVIALAREITAAM